MFGSSQRLSPPLFCAAGLAVIAVFAGLCLESGSAEEPEAVGGLGRPRTLLVHAEWENCMDDLLQGLEESGQLGTVEAFNARVGTPTLELLQTYDVILTWSNWEYANGSLLGDRLADYVDGGGAVVVALFGNSALNARLRGRWDEEKYWIIPPQGWTGGGPLAMGSAIEPTHPILRGVQRFDGGPTSARPTAFEVRPGSRRLVEWEDGSTLVAIGPARRVDLGMWPGGSNGCGHGDGWDSSTDGLKLMANAITFAARHRVRR